MATQSNPNFFPGGFASGLVVKGVPLVQMHPGLVWWVSNNTTVPSIQGGVGTTTVTQRIPFVGGSDGNPGSWNKPFKTLAYALTVANPGDIIFIKPNHAETYSAASALNFATANIAIVGLGTGSARPTFTLDTAATTNLQIKASNLTFQNLLFIGNFAAITTCFNVANAQVAKEVIFDNCEWRDAASNKGFLAAVKVGTTANIADGLTVNNCKMFCLAGTNNANQMITLASVTDRLTITGNYVVSAATSAQTPVLVGLGSALNHTNVLISKNQVVTPTTDSTNGSAVGGSGTMTGLASDNYIANLDNTASIWIPTGLGLMYVQNFSHITAAADKNALINPSAV